jgi:hypothetical protein
MRKNLSIGAEGVEQLAQMRDMLGQEAASIANIRQGYRPYPTDRLPDQGGPSLALT